MIQEAGMKKRQSLMRADERRTEGKYHSSGGDIRKEDTKLTQGLTKRSAYQVGVDIQRCYNLREQEKSVTADRTWPCLLYQKDGACPHCLCLVDDYSD